MSLAIIGTIGALGAIKTSEFSRQSIYITTKKVFELLMYFSNKRGGDSTSALTSGMSYKEIVASFSLENHIHLKITTAEEIIKSLESTNCSQSKAVEITCIALHESIIKIHKELESLQTLLREHEKKWFNWMWTPDYEKHLKQISHLLKYDFEVCFTWLERAVKFNQ